MLTFAEDLEQADERLRGLVPLFDHDVIAWIAYPKGGKAAGREISRDTLAALALTLGLAAIANFSVDQTWSSLRIRRLKPGE